MKTTSYDYKYQHLGTVYRTIEQFELISRTDLAKLSGFAPASITALTKSLIEHHFIIERSAQNLATRGRPAVGLAVSPFYWHLLCLTIAPQKVTIALCDLTGKALQNAHYSLSEQKYQILDDVIVECLQNFFQQYPLDHHTLLAVSISVIGKISSSKTQIIQLGNIPLVCSLIERLQPLFPQPILMNEHFQLWFLAESTLGSLIGNDNVIFLELDDTINLSVLLKGALLHQDEHKRMNVDKMIMPKFSPLSDEISDKLSDLERYQLCNQVTFSALVSLIDRHLPNTLTNTDDKIQWLCECIQDNQPKALAIFEHITDNLAYTLMNLINIFSTEKIMLSTPLLQIKSILFEKLQQKLAYNLLNDLKVDLVTSQYDWESSLIPAVALKLGIYEGTLLRKTIQF